MLFFHSYTTPNILVDFCFGRPNDQNLEQHIPTMYRRSYGTLTLRYVGPIPSQGRLDRVSVNGSNCEGLGHIRAAKGLT